MMRELRVGLRGRFIVLFVGSALVGLTFLYLLVSRTVPGAGSELGWAFVAGGGVSLVLAGLGSYLAVRSVRRSLSGYARALERGESEALELLVSPVAHQVQRLARDMVRIDSRLKEEHTRYNAVLKGMDAGVFAVDGDGRITVCNPAFQEMFEIKTSPDDRPYRDLLTNPALQDAIEEARGGRSVRIEIDIGNAPHARTLVAHVSPLGRLGGAAATVRDVTAIRYLERVRRDFVANISHELRTPIAVIRASAETLLDGALSDPPVARDFLEQIERHAARMGNIIEGLLELARLEAGQQSLAREPVNVRASAQRALDLVTQRIRTRGLAVDFDVPADLFALADTKGLDQVLSNLVENAAKYASEGGRIGLHALAMADGSLVIRVRDDGPGIAPVHRARVFERFYRIDKGRSRDTGGTGLGLAIVKHLTLAMGGEVSVEGAEPTGSIFEVRLQLAEVSGERGGEG
jgi:two-component system phosphate regulon sensor histidine kinase PhoR